jgi:DNA polymerase-1
MPQLEPYPQPEIKVVRTNEDLAELVRQLSYEPIAIGLDIETTGLNPRTDRIRLLQLAVTAANQPVFVLDLFHWDAAALEPLWDELTQLDGPKVVGHNFQFDCGFLFRLGVEIPAHRTTCTLLAERVLVAGRKEPRIKGKKGPAEFSDIIDGDGEDPSFAKIPCGLADIAARRLKLELSKEQQRSNWAAPQLSREQIVYSAIDPKATLAIFRLQDAELRFDKGLRDTVDLEWRLINTTVWLQANGMPVDVQHAEALHADLGRELLKARATFVDTLDSCLREAGARPLPRDMFGEIDIEAGGVNLNHSPTLLGWINRLPGLKLESLDKNVIKLAEIDHPAIEAFKAYRQAESLLRYITAFRKSVSPEGRVFGQFVQMGADSGRILSKAPNLQNLPRDSRFRRLIAAPAGWKIIGADYSQIESRLMAVISQDENLLKIFREKLDVYIATAALTSGKSLSEVTKDDRQSGKLLVLSLQYGMGSKKLQRVAFTNFGLRMTEAEAIQSRKAFFDAYEGIAALHRKVADRMEGAQVKGEAWLDFRTLRGRRRWVQAGELATGINAPVQGLGCDILKLALSELSQALYEGGAPLTQLIGTIHDEILLCAPDAEVATASAVLERVMNDAARPFLGDISAGAKAVAGLDWSQAKD